MSAPIILDTDKEMICFVCDIPIWPSEPKIVLGTKEGFGLYVAHLHCANLLPRDL